MPGFEEEAFQRAQRISRPRTQREKPEAPSSMPRREKPVPKDEPVQEENSEKELKPQFQQPKAGLLETLFRDKEKSIILALILLLSDDGNDPSLLLALAYLLM